MKSLWSNLLPGSTSSQQPKGPDCYETLHIWLLCEGRCHSFPNKEGFARAPNSEDNGSNHRTRRLSELWAERDILCKNHVGCRVRSCGVMVSTWDSESQDPSSSLGRTCFFFLPCSPFLIVAMPENSPRGRLWRSSARNSKNTLKSCISD